MASGVGMVLALGLLSAIGSGAGSFSVLIGAAAKRLPPESRGPASGIINAGGSFGQFVFAPILQRLIQALGWMGAMWSLAVVTLAALPLVRSVAGPPADAGKGRFAAIRECGTRSRGAFADRSYLLLHAGFFTCGFHIAFLVTHLPGEVNLCGLPPTVASWSLAIIGLANIFGSLLRRRGCRPLSQQVHPRRHVWLARAADRAPTCFRRRPDLTFYIFAAGLGFTWLATVPPTAAIVGKLFGVRYLGTLFGLTLLSHQIGGFFGAWLGGLAIDRFGDYQWMWYADMALAVAAALGQPAHPRSADRAETSRRAGLTPNRQSTSNRPAAPMPPPMHMVTTTYFTPRRLPSISAWPVRRAPRHAVGMADGDGAAVDVEPVVGNAELVAAVDHLHREGLVQFPQADVLHLQAGALRAASARRTPGRCPSRRARSRRPRSRGRCRAASGLRFAASLGVHHHAGRRAVGELAGVARGDHAARRAPA